MALVDLVAVMIVMALAMPIAMPIAMSIAVSLVGKCRGCKGQGGSARGE